MAWSEKIEVVPRVAIFVLAIWQRKSEGGKGCQVGWKAEHLIVAHGTCVEEGASAVIERALSWI